MNPYNEQEIRQFKTRVASIAQGMIDRHIGIIQGARELSKLSTEDGADRLGYDFVAFIALDSETDHLPVGDERSYWAKSALLQKDEEIDQIESEREQEILAACQRLVAQVKGSYG